MRAALESLPWVRKASVNYEHRIASVTALSDAYVEKELTQVLEKAGFGGSVSKLATPKQESDKPIGERVAFRVDGMQKTKSGAT